MEREQGYSRRLTMMMSKQQRVARRVEDVVEKYVSNSEHHVSM